MIDTGFPVIEYQPGKNGRHWGEQHGESWREAIRELVSIRTELMFEKNPRLGQDHIPRLAALQWQHTRRYDVELAEELQGIAAGAAISLDDIVILNNYTDFRDIEIDDQGCSTIYVHRNGNRVAGQTWDMHGSAKRFVCCLKIPPSSNTDTAIVFSIVGCVGMMGFSARGSCVGVNNINTNGARPGILWPVLIRKLVGSPAMEQQSRLLRTAPLTSGRTFLIADHSGAGFWEVMPDLCENVSSLDGNSEGHLFHTNHCLGKSTRSRENRIAMTSTTHTRYELIEKKIETVTDIDTAWDLLNDHEGYPRSICSNFQTSSQDPSITCGGAVGDLGTGRIRMWRGDYLHDDNFVEHEFQLDIGPAQ